MGDLFAILLLLSFITLISGLIHPNLVIKWGKRNRKQVLKTYGIAFIVFFILFAATVKEATPDIEVINLPNIGVIEIETDKTK